MSAPLVLVPADVKLLNGRLWHAVSATYLKPMIRVAGCTPLILPSFGPELDLDAALGVVDGVLMTGSVSNVHPERYGEAETPGHEPYDPDRDATSLALIRAAIDRGLPLLCICRGMQELNVALGGTLRTDIHDEPGHGDHRSPGTLDLDVDFGLRQQVRILPGGVLGPMVEAGDVIVNSLHRQAIARPSPRLRVEAVAEDGTVEAVSVNDACAFALGLQWHPEYWADSDPPSNRIFTAFAEAVRAHAAARRRSMAA